LAPGLSESLPPPYVVQFPSPPKPVEEQTETKRKSKKTKPEAAVQPPDSRVLLVNTYKIPNMGPYPFNKPRRNTIRFTPTQVEAIRAGTSPGLTLIVGPPGTGKTDVAVQIIANIYHNFPKQHTLLVTHSNQALNQLFEKIVALG